MNSFDNFMGFINKLYKVLIVLLLFWIFITSTIQRFKCIDLTETEVLLRIPNSIILDWKEC